LGERNNPSIKFTDSPPVIVSLKDVIPKQYPRLEGRYRQPLPKIPGNQCRTLLQDNKLIPQGKVEVWLLPRRIETENVLVISLDPTTKLVINVSKWPLPEDNSRDRYLQRACKILEEVPKAYSTVSSIKSAYKQLHSLWNDKSFEEIDPKEIILKKQANSLRTILDELAARPRTILRSEHHMIKLQLLRRVDAKTLRWLSAQPGRNIAERAGSKQKVKAPKRYETIDTLENSVLNAFASLTVRESKKWIKEHGEKSSSGSIIAAHQMKAQRIEFFLREKKVPKAIAPVVPNFSLRFDHRYRAIWRSWLELMTMNFLSNKQWMWQDRTIFELFQLRASMKLYEYICSQPNAGILSHCPVFSEPEAPNQGSYIRINNEHCVFNFKLENSKKTIDFRFGNDQTCLGVIADVGLSNPLWFEYTSNSNEWDKTCEEWDRILNEWMKRSLS